METPKQLGFAPDEEEDINRIVFKFIIIGSVSVGKSSLLLQFTEQCFYQNLEMTIGVEFGTFLTTMDDGQKVKLQIWDTCGQESYSQRAITRSYYRGAQGILIVYDITRRATFEYLSSWLDECEQTGDSQAVIVLIGNKCDLESDRKVSFEEGRNFAAQNNLIFLETSAKDGVGVDEAFMTASKRIYEKFKTGEIQLNQDSLISYKGYSLVADKQTTPKTETGPCDCAK